MSDTTMDPRDKIFKAFSLTNMLLHLTHFTHSLLHAEVENKALCFFLAMDLQIRVPNAQGFK